MVVREELLATRTVVKVLAHRAFVAGAYNWENSTTVTSASLVGNMRVLNLSSFHHLHDMSEGFLGLFVQVSLNELLHSLDETKGHFLSRRLLETFPKVFLGGSVNHHVWLRSDRNFLVYQS